MTILEVINVSKNFGGLPVLSEVSFSLNQGERVALIGPNGAGKTTLINVLSGIFAPSSGTIDLSDIPVTNLPAHRRVGMGMARSFQLNSLFTELNLVTNVLLAVQGTQNTRFNLFSSMSSHRENQIHAEKLLRSVSLWEQRKTPVSELSHGQQRQMEIIMALASDPKLILLDEPSAGLTSTESVALGKMLKGLPQETTVLFSAHDLDLVFSLASKVIVLHNGEIVTIDSPSAIQKNSKVQEIYLGASAEGKNDA